MENGTVSVPFESKYGLKIPNAAKNGEVIEFFIETVKNGHSKEIVVIRVFEDFELLHHSLSTQPELAYVILPPLPSKPLTSASAAKKKTKKQLGTASLLVGDDYSDDCRAFEKYLLLLTRHKAIGHLPVLEKFLCEKDPVTRVRVKKSIFGAITKVVDDARFNFYKDCDDKYQSIRDHNEEMLKYMKFVAQDFQKISDNERKMATLCVNMCNVLQQLSAEENKESTLPPLYGHLSDSLDHVREVSIANAANRTRTLASTLHLYAGYEEAKKTTLQRRTQRLAALDNAKKTFENAKPLKKAQADENLKMAEQSFKNISEQIKLELDIFNKQRILSLQSAMVQFADAEIKNSRDTYALLAKTVAMVQKQSS